MKTSILLAALAFVAVACAQSGPAQSSELAKELAQKLDFKHCTFAGVVLVTNPNGDSDFGIYKEIEAWIGQAGELETRPVLRGTRSGKTRAVFEGRGFSHDYHVYDSDRPDPYVLLPLLGSRKQVKVKLSLIKAVALDQVRHK